jgi:aryl sulfotransferase
MNATAQVAWPIKRREMVEWVIDSRPWNDIVFRDDDIVICAWAKSGTTWMQQILAQLILGGSDIYGPDVSPWIDGRFFSSAAADAEAQTHRRFLKSHLPIDATVYSPKAKYIYIGRDVRDTYWSWHNHQSSFTPEILGLIQSFPGQEPGRASYPNPDIRLAFGDWLERDGYPNIPYFSHIQGWFDARHLPNLKLFHYADLKADFEGEVRRVADFLGLELDESRVPEILERCSFAHMKVLARKNALHAKVFKRGGDSFINEGTNGRWRGVLTGEDIASADAAAARHLSADCARWLATGELPDAPVRAH